MTPNAPISFSPVERLHTLKGARSRCGRKPFGSFSGEDAIILKMLSLRNGGMGFDTIAARLNSEGVRSRTGKPWHGRVVNRIIRAEMAKLQPW